MKLLLWLVFAAMVGYLCARCVQRSQMANDVAKRVVYVGVSK